MRVRTGFKSRVCLSAALVLALLGVSSPSLAAGGVCERIVVTGNAQYPPVLWVDPDDSKRLVGAAVELLENALEGSGIHVDVLNVGPWARAQEEVRSGRVDMLAGAFLTPGRLAEMDYVYPPYMEVPSVIFVKRGKAFPYSGWDDLRGKRGSSLVSNSFGAAFDTYAADHLDINTVPSIEQSFELLLRDRTDYVVYERHQGLALAAQMNILEQLDVLEGSLINEPLYYTVSHNSACNSPALRAALAQGMHRMVRQGEPRRLVEKYRDIWNDQFAPISQEEPALE
ncbi:amino acid ABC transporter substrate-binding protein, PAAT family [Halopseudomonas litoralis]|uniref:Amino acid ABC transporter substrate-binding protein, PAAT family n=1 Tax=Halopseudomonas litoralis TaxID=797277 RepID=A0A1H1RHN0_9GAMM|nr:transporter substrate-binding domain-containing protein [Halopseudomonas litoralis]SDS35202.1 amino acid ABC transporter substrate-binding protein, PAAT family [Halopseudomonas litoralis]